MTVDDRTPERRQRLLMDRGWKFHAGEPQAVPIRGHMPTYHATRTGGAPGPANPSWEDSSWRIVDLPHDFAVEQPMDPSASPNQGYRPRGIGWYRKSFRLDPSLRDRWLAIEVGAAATHSTVWLNGTLLRRHHGGYTPFVMDITPFAAYGDAPNVLAVRVDAEAFEGWWYEGAGMYRHVWLHCAHPVHVAPWGAFANPVTTDLRIWDTRIETRVENTGGAACRVSVCSTVVAPDGRTIGTASSHVEAPRFGSAVVRHAVPVEGPALWSPDSPALHRLRTEVLVDGTVVDSTATEFGYRTVRFDADLGFFLNDAPVKIKGTCNHQDHAGVGVALPDSLHEYRIRRLKEMGSNACRCAHNPPAEELLDACDRLGMMVMDENRVFSAAPDAMADMETMVLRDRNHPSAILWSLFNEEVFTQGGPVGRRIAERMAARVRELDPSRPVTGAINEAMFDEQGVAPVLDVIGINYRQDSYDPTHARHPRIPLLATENACVYATRGAARTDPRAMRWDNYDERHTDFGETARRNWLLVNERPFMAGCFVWTGFDYRGEPYPYLWPCAGAHLGILDSCGFAKDGFHLYRALWTEEPLVHILPHWNHPGMEGEPIRVMCYTNCDEVELFLNGKSRGAKTASAFQPPEWSVPWSVGELMALGRRGGAEAATDRVETTGEPLRVRLAPYRIRLDADGRDAVPVTAWVEDARGRPVPTASCRIAFHADGPIGVIGVGNGDPLCHEPDKAASRSLFHGLCQAIVQSGGDTGRAVLTASSPGLEPARLAMECGPAASMVWKPPGS